MELQIMERVRNQLRTAGTTSQSSAAYECRECCDSGWVRLKEGSYKRCRCTELKVIKLCWENYGVKPDRVKPINDYIAYNKVCAAAKQKAANYVTDFEENCKEENNWFGLFGQPGAGKSHLAIAIGAALLSREKKPVKVVYMPYLEVMRELKANSMDNEYYIKQLSRYQRAEVLVIDDLFKDKVRNGKLLYELAETDVKHGQPTLNFRYYNNLPTIISSECTPEMLHRLDCSLGDRILERCNTNINVFQGEEFNYRLRRFERK